MANVAKALQDHCRSSRRVRRGTPVGVPELSASAT